MAEDAAHWRKSGDGAAIRKVCAVLRALGSGREQRLTQIAEVAELNKVSALRILRQLIEEEFVSRSADGRRYRLGREPAVLSSALAATFADLRDCMRPSLLRVVSESGYTVLFNILAGHDAVCVDKILGSYPVETPQQIGTRVPLGVSAGGIVILAAMNSNAAEHMLSSVEHLFGSCVSMTRQQIETDVIAARQGYFISEDRRGMSELAAPIMLTTGHPVGSLAITAPNECILSRAKFLVPLVMREAQSISDMAVAHAAARTRSAE